MHLSVSMDRRKFFCNDCGIKFYNEDCLEKHKKQFCLESSKKRNLWNKSLQEIGTSPNMADLQQQAIILQQQKAGLLKQLDELKNKCGAWSKDKEKSPCHKFDHTRSAWKETFNDVPDVQNKAGNNFLNEVRLMHDEYLQNGGNDVNVLNYFFKLENEIIKFNQNNQNSSDFNSNEVMPEQNLMKQLKFYEKQNKKLEKQLKKAYKQQAKQEPFGNNMYLGNGCEQQYLSGIYQTNGRYVTDPSQLLRNNHLNVQQRHQQFNERRIFDMHQETEYYRQQIELEHLRQQLNTLRGSPNKQVLPGIGVGQANHPQLPLANNACQMSTENDLYVPTKKRQSEAFQQGPYDPGTGFTMFWDFVSIAERPHGCCSLLVTLYREEEMVSDTKSLPVIPYGIHSSNYPNILRTTTNVAVIGVKQLFPKCYPDPSLSLVVCVRQGISLNGGVLSDDEQLEEYGWCKINLFDTFNRAICGRWKTPIRMLPVQPELSMAELNTLRQIGQSELFYRLVNTRDSETQERTVLTTQLMANYKYLPIETIPILKLPQLTFESHYGPPKKIQPLEENSSPRPSSSRRDKHHRQQDAQYYQQFPHQKQLLQEQQQQKLLSNQQQHQYEPQQQKHNKYTSPLHSHVDITVQKPISSQSRTSLRSTSLKESMRIVDEGDSKDSFLTDQSPDGFLAVGSRGMSSGTIQTPIQCIECDIGIQFHQVVDLSGNPIKVLLYFRNPDGKVACSNDGAAEFSTEWTKTSFLRLVHCFGSHEVYFRALQLFRWSTLYIEVFEQSEDLTERLIAWSVISLFKNGNNNHHSKMTLSQPNTPNTLAFESLALNFKVGVFRIPLYKPPVSSVKDVVEKLKVDDTSSFIATLQKSVIFINVFREEKQRRCQAPWIPPVPKIGHPPTGAWIECVREPPNKLFRNGDGFDVYVDRARYLPDSCVIAKVVVGLFDGMQGKKKQFSKAFETNLSVDMSSAEPVFESRFEFRDLAYLSQTKLVFLVYILNEVTKKVCFYGQSIVPLFVKPGTFEYAGNSCLEYCLNAGALQLKLYQTLEDKVHYDYQMLKDPVPCSSLLVRILQAASYSNGEPKRANDIPRDEWINEGILIPIKSYEQGQYESLQCKPAGIELELLHHFVTRRDELVKNRAREISNEVKKTMTDYGLLEWLKAQFKTLDEKVVFDMRFQLRYSSYYGFLFSLEKAQNITWSGFTFATYCVSPPACFYQGMIDDPVAVVFKVSEDSLIRHVQWLEGIKVFSRRCYHENLSIVIQMYEVTERDGDFVFSPQAWTLIPLLKDGYLLHSVFQMPLFQGSPSKTVLASIQQQPLMQTITALKKKKVLKFVEGTSVFVKVGDPRRSGDDMKDKPVDQSMLPNSNKFLKLSQSKQVKSLVPVGIPFEQYVDSMGRLFKQYILQNIKTQFLQRIQQT